VLLILAVSILSSEAKVLTEAIFPLGEPDWLNWSCDKDDTLGLACGFCQMT